MNRRPIVWSIAGHDSSGGAGLSADQRAADALGVHLCPVVAAVTAQSSLGVQAVRPVAPDLLGAQFAALASDLPPRAIKTGLLGSIAAVEQVARWVDHWRARAPAGTDPHAQLALVIDPVLGASAGGTAFASPELIEAYRRVLLPRATVITPHRAEAARLLGRPDAHHALPAQTVPEMARQLQALGVRSVVITGGDAPMPASPRPTGHGQAIDWLLAPEASGWLTAPRVATPHHHGTGCTFATGLASAMALGHGAADAAVLAKMLTHHALAHGHAAGQGAGPVVARAGFAQGPAHGGAPLPWLGLQEQLPWALQDTRFAPFTAPADGLYGILDSAARIREAAAQGLGLLQLRRKTRDHALPQVLTDSLRACAATGTTLFINDHWREALALPGGPGIRLGVHLGQEDLLALEAQDQALLRERQDHLLLGLSSHSLWELARAAGCGASVIACGPVHPTSTKDMPWRPQGPDNLRWWVAHSPVPVVAIGGLMGPDELQAAAACGPAALCVVRGLGQTDGEMQRALPALRRAITQGREGHRGARLLGPVALPHPVL